jgi:lysophospholipase L1-like esterase
MPTLLCYGDSNTWGFEPGTGRRFPEPRRWPGVLRRQLPEACVLEEGLSGRTTVLDDPWEPGRNGEAYLVPCLASHRPLELVVLMLGTNDAKGCFPHDAAGIAAGAGRLVDLALRSQAGPDERAPRVLLVAPPPVTAPGPLQEVWGFSAASVERSRGLARLYRAVAENRGCAFLDAGAHVAVSPVDGVHLDAVAHELLGTAVAEAVRGMLGLG